MTATRLSRGEVFEGKYRVERRLGGGGMGTVYEAYHLQLHVPVALKVLRSDLIQTARDGAAAVAADRVEVDEHFFREARAAARVHNEHVAQVFDVGCTRDGESFIVMELLHGFDLSEAELGAALPVDSVVNYVLQAARGMHVAHERGVIHRDLKPSNLFVTRDVRNRPLIKILDFGISKQEGVHAGVITNSGHLMGSPCYVAPEQARDPRNVDARADIWSMGVILYELLSAQLPFDGEEVGQILSRVLVDQPIPLAELRPDLDSRLCDLVMRCLNKEPALRPQSMAELADELQPFATETPSHPTRSRSVPVDTSAPAVSEPRSVPPPKPRTQDTPAQAVTTARSGAGARRTEERKNSDPLASERSMSGIVTVPYGAASESTPPTAVSRPPNSVGVQTARARRIASAGVATTSRRLSSGVALSVAAVVVAFAAGRYVSRVASNGGSAQDRKLTQSTQGLVPGDGRHGAPLESSRLVNGPPASSNDVPAVGAVELTAAPSASPNGVQSVNAALNPAAPREPAEPSRIVTEAAPTTSTVAPATSFAAKASPGRSAVPSGPPSLAPGLVAASSTGARLLAAAPTPALSAPALSAPALSAPARTDAARTDAARLAPASSAPVVAQPVVPAPSVRSRLELEFK